METFERALLPEAIRAIRQRHGARDGGGGAGPGTSMWRCPDVGIPHGWMAYFMENPMT